MRKTTKLRNVLQIVALSAPPVLMALAGLLLQRRPKGRAIAHESKRTHSRPTSS